MEKLISIICTSYNIENFIGETIKSVLDQTYENYELLIVDDASDDKSVEVIKSFSDKRIKLFINEKRMGAAYSRNRATKEAKGEYLAFLDGDDLWVKDKLEKQLKFMEENGYLFSCTAFQQVDEKGSPLNRFVIAPKVMKHRTFLRTNYVGCSTVIVKRELYHDHVISDKIYKRNDYALWILISEKAPCYSFDEVLTLYRRRENSISSSSKSSLLKYHRIMWKELYGFSSFKAWIYSLRNGFYFFYRKIFYLKKKHK